MKNLMLCTVLACCLAACTPSEPTLLDEINASLDLAVEQSLRMAESMQHTGRLPQTIVNGELKTSNSAWWTSGFFPGLLWQLYDYSGNDSLRLWAEDYTMRVYDQQYTTNNHDVGFMVFCSFGNGYRLTADPMYKAVIDTASQSLITRFRPRTGCIRSWDDQRWQYAVIIDNMMNLEMLMWASRTFDNPVYRSVAVTHANTTMQHHFRPDYSTWHVVSYDTLTGEVDRRQTAQGYSDDSAWARGQSWGLYGYTMMFRETGDSAYLHQAEHIADFLMNHPNLPEDKIPYWDYNAPGMPDVLRDVSAGAIMCSALIELADYTDAARSRQCMDVATTQLRALCSPAYRAPLGENCNFLLMHSVGNMPGGTEVDVPLTYADYYYVEAMLRYRSRMMRSATSSGVR